MPCWRGSRLFDSESTKAFVVKWVQFYKRHRALLTSDLIHVRRPDQHGLDCVLHANPTLADAQGLAMVFNPTNHTVRTELPLPLYYTGLTDGVTVVFGDVTATAKRMQLERDYSLFVPLELAPRTATWLTFAKAAA